jgi:hypothetical protein
MRVASIENRAHRLYRLLARTTGKPTRGPPGAPTAGFVVKRLGGRFARAIASRPPGVGGDSC